MFIRLTLILLLILTAQPLRLFLIGGNTDEKDVLVYQQLAASVPSRPAQSRCDQDWSTTNCPRIAVITSAASNYSDGNSSYYNDTEGLGYFTMFNQFGMSPKHISVHRDNYKTDGNPASAEGAANLAILRSADIIYFNGGDQSRHIRAWLNDDGSQSPLLAAVKERAFGNEVVLSGTSAGSMIWGPQTVGGGSSFGILYFKNTIGLAPKKITDAEVGGSGFDDVRNGSHGLQYDYNGGKMKAFKWIDWHVDTHFHARGRLGRLPALLVDTQQSLGVGIDEKTAFFYQDGVGTVYGYNGATVCDLSNALIKPLPFFVANNIRSHYLTPKDSYDFKSKKVSSSKQLITSPAYTGPTDSSDILSSYEVPLLMTRQIDQRAVYNLGKTKHPSAFSSRNPPVFEIKFNKDQTSTGYYTNKMYTVFNLVLEFSYGANVESEASQIQIETP